MTDTIRDEIARGALSVLWNAKNYPEPVSKHILGRDVRPLSELVTDALMPVVERVNREAAAEAVDGAKQLVMQYLTTAEQWRYDEVAEALTRRAAAIRPATPVHDKQGDER